MSAANLSDRLNEAHRNLADLQQRVQKTAVDAHQDVTHLLELALTSLLKVITTVHARYTEDGELDDDGKKMLSKMKESFDTVETAAKSCSNDLGKLHEHIEILQSSTISPLSKDIEFNLCDAERRIKEADKERDDLQREIDDGQERFRRGQEVVGKYEGLIDSPVADVATTIASPFMWLGHQISGGNSDFDKPMEDLKRARRQLEDIRTDNLGIQRRKTEAEQRLLVLRGDREQAEHLQDQVGRLEPHATKLANRADQFKAAVIHIKAKATALRLHASDVEASASVTSTKSYSKSEFAIGLLSIVEEAIFDSVIKDEVDYIMAEMLRLWTVDGTNQMPKRLKKKYDEVRAKIDQLQQGSAEDEWNKAVGDTQSGN